jgi:hypothetical protein
MNAESTNAKTAKAARSRKTVKPTQEPNALTLKQLADQYTRELERAGKSPGTVFSYRMEMEVALAQLGAETAVASITTKQVQSYFASDAVNKTRTGRGKAQPTILKTQRVLRLALAWAAEKRLIAKSPIEEAAASRPVKKAKPVAAPGTASTPKTTATESQA